MFRNPFKFRPTVAALADNWRKSAKLRHSANWHKQTCRHLRNEILPVLGHRIAADVTRRDVAAMLEGMTDRPGIHNQVLNIIRGIFRQAVETGHLENMNAVEKIRKLKLATRDRVLTDAEISVVWRALEGMEDYTRIIRLLLLTGQRREEISALKWSEIVLEGPGAPYIELPPSRTKNRQPHRIPLAPLALAQLPPRREGREWLFGRCKQNSFTGHSTCKKLLNAKLVGVPRWKTHDLRRTFVTHMADKGLAPPHIVEAVVNHKSGHQGGVAGVYNKALYTAEKASALNAWAEEVARIVGIPPLAEAAE